MTRNPIGDTSDNVTQMQDLTPPDHLCLIRLSALGDVCHTVALARALAITWPNTQITWIIGTKEAPLVADMPDIRFITYNKSANIKSALQIWRELRKTRFDVLVLAQTSARANLLSLFIRAKRRVGFGGTWAREGHSMVVNETTEISPTAHQAEAIFEFAKQVTQQSTLALSEIDRGLPIQSKAMDFACQHQPKANEAVLISPCSSHPLRNWNAKGYATVADWIVSKTRRPVILVGGPSNAEKEMGRQIENLMHHPVTNLIGQDTLAQAVAMLKRAAVLITPDSGPAHMADGLGTPVIGLYAATRVASSGPWASQSWCIDAFSKAASQFKQCLSEDLPWSARIEKPGVMDLIAPHEVIEELERLLESQSKSVNTD